MMKRILILLFILCNSILLVAQHFQLDKGHTLIQFNVDRFMVGEVTGVFKEFTGSIDLDRKNGLFKSNIEINAESLDTNHDVRDGHLKGKTWLDVDSFPTISFLSEKIENKDGEWILTAQLRIKAVTNTVQFPIEIKGPFVDPTGSNTIGILGELIIDRQDYGISFSKLMDNGELFIGNEVRIKIRALGIQSQ